jgi:hypothetical protein
MAAVISLADHPSQSNYTGIPVTRNPEGNSMPI